MSDPLEELLMDDLFRFFVRAVVCVVISCQQGRSSEVYLKQIMGRRKQGVDAFHL